MNKTAVARELVRVAKSLVGDIDWSTVNREANRIFRALPPPAKNRSDAIYQVFDAVVGNKVIMRFLFDRLMESGQKKLSYEDTADAIGGPVMLWKEIHQVQNKAALEELSADRALLTMLQAELMRNPPVEVSVVRKDYGEIARNAEKLQKILRRLDGGSTNELADEDEATLLVEKIQLALSVVRRK